MPHPNHNNRPIDYIASAGALSSLAIGLGGVMYCAFFNKDINSIKTPIKYMVVSTSALGGAVCGAALVGIVVYAACTGSSGNPQADKDAETKDLTLKFAALGGGIGGAGGLGFGFVANKSVFTLSKAISNYVPKEVIIGASVLAATMVASSCLKDFLTNNSPIAQPEEETVVTGDCDNQDS
jgi:hypothetical protein